jgi:hypothetical protein
MSVEQTQVKEEVESKPVFDEIKNMNESQAIDVLIQAASLSQSSGRLSVRDSVMLAKAIDVIRPGSI